MVFHLDCSQLRVAARLVVPDEIHHPYHYDLITIADQSFEEGLVVSYYILFLASLSKNETPPNDEIIHVIILVIVIVIVIVVPGMIPSKFVVSIALKGICINASNRFFI
jgi:hypothetical protein